MALCDLLNMSNDGKKIGLSEERVKAILPIARQYIAFFREYPDMFVDFLSTGWDPERKPTLKFYFYQRVFLRAAMRHRYTYMVFPRAFSKSFLAILTLMIKCVLFPGCKLFVTAGGKEQAAGIMKEKFDEICTLVPAFRKEFDFRRGKSLEGKDYCKYICKNGSYFDNIAARESSRGKRRHSGLVEECVGVDGDILSQVIIPTMNVDRRCADGTVHEEELLNKQQIFVTTAGYKGTFAYRKLITLLVRSIIDPDLALVMGGTWRIPVLMGLQSKNFVEELKQDETFNEIAFQREYESIWAGSSEEAFFNGDWFDQARKLKQPEFEYSGRSSAGAYYVLAMDVGRKGCASEIMVFKVTPQAQGPAIKSLVNVFSIEDMHFEDQSIFLKKKFFDYKAKIAVVDGNGMGIGFVDYLVKPQVDPETGDILPPFGVENDPDGFYKKFITPDTEMNALYIMKANAPINTEAHANVQAQLRSGHLRLLVNEQVARNSLLGTKKGQAMKPEQRQIYLKPWQLTSVLKEQMMNLKEENAGININLKQVNRSIPKDKFSAFEYGLWWIRQEEERANKRKKRRFSDFMFMT